MASAAALVGTSIEFDDKQYRELQRVLQHYPKAVNKSLAFILNDTAKTGERLLVTRLLKELNLTRSKIRGRGKRKNLKIRRARPAHLVSHIDILHNAIPLVNYLGSPSKAARLIQRPGKRGGKPVKVRVRKRGAVERHTESFVARMPGGHVGIYRRTDDEHWLKKGPGNVHWRSWGRGQAGRWVEKIRESYGPSIPGAFKGAPGVARHIMSNLDREILRATDRTIKLLIDGKTPIARRLLGIRS